MDIKKLKELEKSFLLKFPGGFENEFFKDIEKKHKMEQMTGFVKENFAKKKFTDKKSILDNYIKLITRSSMVSVFEKAKFKDFGKGLSNPDGKELVESLEEFLYGTQKTGFESLVHVLNKGKLAKWPIITCLPAYNKPDKEVFIKPTTAKGVIELLKIENLVYKPSPTWDFYDKYRKKINEMKKHVDKRLSPSNPAFSGFLMMSLPK
ncbi:MAG: hypothetical protein KDK36_07165 [Leptospiraceae bacterium]|nr:hypothetical protein [Leptospiraceae bacterium]